MLTGKELGTAIETALKRKGVSKAQMARDFGVKPPSVSGWVENGRIAKERLPDLFQYFEDVVPPEHWGIKKDSTADMVLYINGQERTSLWLKQPNETSNVSAAQIRGYIPLISWVQAGTWEEAIDLYQPGDAESIHHTTVPHSLNTFALRVDGDSMTAPPGAPGHSFPHGMIIYVDPNQEALPGDYVVAKHNGHGHVTFKRYATEEGRPVLKPLNTNGQYPIIRDEFEIIGKVIDASWGGL